MKNEVATCVEYLWKNTQTIDWEQSLLLGRTGWGKRLYFMAYDLAVVRLCLCYLCKINIMQHFEETVKQHDYSTNVRIPCSFAEQGGVLSFEMPRGAIEENRCLSESGFYQGVCTQPKHRSRW